MADSGSGMQQNELPLSTLNGLLRCNILVLFLAVASCLRAERSSADDRSGSEVRAQSSACFGDMLSNVFEDVFVVCSYFCGLSAYVDIVEKLIAEGRHSAIPPIFHNRILQ